jgi:hypothetical protein
MVSSASILFLFAAANCSGVVYIVFLLKWSVLVQGFSPALSNLPEARCCGAS